jgi:hypothetical protein
MASSKRQRTLAFADRVARFGVEMPPCSRCASKGETCIVSLQSQKCSGCIRSGRRCDAFDLSLPAFERITRAVDKIREEKEKTLLDLQQTQAKGAELMARFIRLSKQEEQAHRLESNLVHRGVEELGNWAEDPTPPEGFASIAAAASPSLQGLIDSLVPETLEASVGTSSDS